MEHYDKHLCAALKYKGNKLGQIRADGYSEESYPELYERLIDYVWFEVSSNKEVLEVEGVFKWVPDEKGAGEWVAYEQEVQGVKQ